MPNIRGTNGNDNIDVTDDNGTLNGVSQGTPIDNIRARGGDDTITVNNSTITGTVRANGGADDIIISGSTIGGALNSGSGTDTITIEGSSVGSIQLGGGNDTLNLIGSTVSGGIQGGGGTDTLNLPAGTVITDTTHGTITVTDGGSYSLSSGSFTLPSGTVISYSGVENGTGFPCFMRGTYIETLEGLKCVQDLSVGDQIPTQNSGTKSIRWIGRRRFNDQELEQNPKLRPIRICAGAMGNGLPRRDLVVSRQHRMLVQSKIAERMFGETEVLIPAIKLTEMPGIFIDDTIEIVEYFHLLFDQHEIVFAEGAPTESLYTGPEALKTISPEYRREIMAIFPEVAELDYFPEPARLIPPGNKQKQLIARHVKNNKMLLA